MTIPRVSACVAALAAAIAFAAGPALAADDIPYPIVANSDLPAAVAETREAIMAAARTGEVDALLPVMLAYGAPRAGFGFAGDEPPDVVLAYWKERGPAESRALLAVLLEILEMPAARFEAQPHFEASYAWPYLIGLYDQLTPAQEVDLFRLMTPEIWEWEKENWGGYTYYRLSIEDDGSWRFFLAGD